MRYPNCWRFLLLAAALFWHACAIGYESPKIDRLKFDIVGGRLDVPDLLFLAMEQDQTGMIWILSKDSLIRFDGSGFKVFPTGVPGYARPIDQYRQALFVDGNDDIWIGRGAVISRFSRTTESFEDFYLEKGEGVSGISGIAQDKDGHLYTVSSNGDLYRYSETKNAFSVVLTPQESVDSYSFNIDTEGRFWIGGRTGLYRYYPSKKSIEKLDPQKSGEPVLDSIIYSIQSYTDDRILLGTQDDGFVMLQVGTGEVVQYPFKGWIYRVATDSSGNIYVGGTSGMVVLEAETNRVYPYVFNEDNPDSMPAGTVWSILPDQEGNLWASTSRSGLLVAYADLGFENLHFKADWIPLVPRKNNVSAIAEDSKSNLWLGYHGDGVEKLDYQNHTSWFGGPGTDPSGQVGLGSVYKLLEGSDGNIYVGCSLTGLSIIDPETGTTRFVHDHSDDKPSLGEIDLRDMAFVSDGKLWLMFHENTVDIYDPETEEFRHLVSYANPLDPVNRLWFFDLMIDSEKRVWLCSSVGLWVFSEDGELQKDFMDNFIGKGLLSHLTIHCIWEDKPGCYWIGTTQGLFYLDTHLAKTVSYTGRDGLPSDQICSVNGTHDGTVWVATENGISHFDPATREFTNYHANDGLPSNGYYIGATCHSADGALYFGGNHGVVKFYPENIRQFDGDAPVIISGFKLYNRDIAILEPENPHAILTSSIETTERIVLPYEPYTVTFEFVALSLRNSFENRFSYKLDGFDEEWSALDRRRDCTYTNLNPGHYVFRVRAKNFEGRWLTGEANLEVVILPPYWKSPWFRLLAGFLIVFVAGTAYYLRVRFINEKRMSLQRLVDVQTRQLRDAMHELEVQKIQIAEQNKRLMEHQHNLEERIRERTEELEISKTKAEESDRIKSAFLENISHEFRTPMNAILGGVTIICEEDISKEDRNYYASVIKQNTDSLLKLIDDILDLSRMEAGELPIQLAPIDVDFFCEQLFSGYGEYMRIQGKSTVDLVLEKNPKSQGQSDLFITDKKRLTQALSHLIENAIKFTSLGTVRFGYRFVLDQETPRIQFFVEDTGIGIPTEQIEHIFDQFTKFYNHKESLHAGTGLGLSIVKKLTDSMGGQIHVDSVHGQGTTVILEFPYADKLEWD